MPLELLLLSICFGSQMSNDACRSSFDKYRSMHPEFNEQMKVYERQYTNDLPAEMLVLGVFVNDVYRKELKVGIYKGWYVDLKDKGQGLFGYKFSF